MNPDLVPDALHCRAIRVLDLQTASVRCFIQDPLHCQAVRILNLEPVLGAPGLIRQIGALRDNALMAELAGALEDGPAVALDVIIELDSIAHLRDELCKPLLPFNERTLSQIVAVELEQVERD